jgi:hypothetical protein
MLETKINIRHDLRRRAAVAAPLDRRASLNALDLCISYVSTISLSRQNLQHSRRENRNLHEARTFSRVILIKDFPAIDIFLVSNILHDLGVYRHRMRIPRVDW